MGSPAPIPLQGGAPVPTQIPESLQPGGAVDRFSQGVYRNTVGGLVDAGKQYGETTFHPAPNPGDNFVNDVATGIAKAHVDQARKAGNAWHEGHYWEAAGHGLAAALPLVGPAAAQAGEKISKGDVAGGLGEGTGLVGSTLLGGKTAKAAKGGASGASAVEEFENAGKAARAKVNLEASSHNMGDTLNRHIVTAAQDGQPVGWVRATEITDKPGTWSIDQAELKPELRGNGNGAKMYEKLIDHAKKSGAKEVISDAVTSDAAKGVYKSLRDKGYNVTSFRDGDLVRFRVQFSPKELPAVLKGGMKTPAQLGLKPKTSVIGVAGENSAKGGGVLQSTSKAASVALDKTATEFMKKQFPGQKAPRVEVMTPREVPPNVPQAQGAARAALRRTYGVTDTEVAPAKPSGAKLGGDRPVLEGVSDKEVNDYLQRVKAAEGPLSGKR